MVASHAPHSSTARPTSAHSRLSLSLTLVFRSFPRSPRWAASPTRLGKKGGRRGRDAPRKRSDGARAVGERPRSLLGGLVLFAWGVAKLSVARAAGRTHEHCLSFMRLNMPLMAVGLLVQRKHGAPSVLPGISTRTQSVLVGLYTAIGFGLTKIPRPGPDRFPDRFLEYLPERRLYLA